MKKIFFFLALILALVPVTIHAEGFSVLIGAQTVSFGADLGKYYDIPPGPGPALLIGFDVGVPIDLRFGRRVATEENTGEDVTYQWIEAGPHFALGQKGADLQPDVFFGVGSYDLEIGSLQFDKALGGYAGLGIQELISEKYLGRIEVKSAVWKSDTAKTDGVSLNLALFFGARF